MKPFLKWAGGKRWLLAKHPELFKVPHQRLVEPFLGGGSTLFHLEPSSSLVSDKNGNLINLYNCVRNDPRRVETALIGHSRKHCVEYYYHLRQKAFTKKYDRAAQCVSACNFDPLGG